MKTSRILALTAVLTAGVSAPALADWDRIGSISVTYQQDRDSKSPDFGGPVERLQFTARGSDVVCRNISATFGNGTTTSLFSGTLHQGSARGVDLPGTSRDVRRINTNCHATVRSGASIDIAADIGRYRDVWRRSPDWLRLWSKMFAWASTGTSWDNMTSYSVSIGTVSFTGRVQKDGTTGGWAGKSVHSIALTALNGDAYCRRVTATFSDTGNTRDLGLRSNYLRRGAPMTIALPGNSDRDIRRLVLRCRPLDGRSVSIRITGRK